MLIVYNQKINKATVLALSSRCQSDQTLTKNNLPYPSVLFILWGAMISQSKKSQTRFFLLPFFQENVHCRGRVTCWWVRWPCWCCASAWASARPDTSRVPARRIRCAYDNQESRSTPTRLKRTTRPRPARTTTPLPRPSCPSSRFVDREPELLVLDTLRFEIVYW